MLVVVIPVYNEAGCVEQVLREWLASVKDIDACLVAINDGSTDGTQDILETLATAEPRLRVITQTLSAGMAPQSYAAITKRLR